MIQDKNKQDRSEQDIHKTARYGKDIGITSEMYQHLITGACPPGHDKGRSMCQDDFDKMAIHANLSIPVGVGGK
jgi:hypothetical protein